jgi:hypothetical protein
MSKEKVTELWAVLDKDGSVKWSRGGSSTSPRLMVYPSAEQAEKVLKNPWIKQIIPNREMVDVKLIYLAS